MVRGLLWLLCVLRELSGLWAAPESGLLSRGSLFVSDI